MEWDLCPRSTVVAVLEPMRIHWLGSLKTRRIESEQLATGALAEHREHKQQGPLISRTRRDYWASLYWLLITDARHFTHVFSCKTFTEPVTEVLLLFLFSRQGSWGWSNLKAGFRAQAYFLKDFIYLFLERGRREGEREGEKHHVWEINWLVASCTPSAVDLACNPGMCPNWEPNYHIFQTIRCTPPKFGRKMGVRLIVQM